MQSILPPRAFWRMLLTPRLKPASSTPYGLRHGRPIRVGYNNLHRREWSILDAFVVVQVRPGSAAAAAWFRLWSRSRRRRSRRFAWGRR